MKRSNLAVCLLIMCASSAAEIHQDFVDNVEPSQDEDKPASGSINHPYGIPVGTWKITDLSMVEKTKICNQQQTFCSNECGGQDLAIINFCNTTTMGWNCKCKNHVPDTPPYGWPSTISECHGKETACNNGCSFGSTKAICLKACAQYYKCNLAGSPPSGLRVDNENETPNYSIAGIHSPLNSSTTAAQWHVCVSSLAHLLVALTTLIIIIT